MAQPTNATKPLAQMKFLFLMANDPKEVQEFYKTLDIPTEGNPDDGFVIVNLGVSVIYFKSDYNIEKLKEFAWQPGYEAAAGNLTSWSIEYPSIGFKKMYDKLKQSKVNLLKSKPEWRRDSYWGLTVQDPMGNTIEIYAVPEVTPENTDWVN